MEITQIGGERDNRGVVYDCDGMRYGIIKAGAVSESHTHKEREVLFLLEGEIQYTAGSVTRHLKAPIRIETAPHTKHALMAKTDIRILYYR